MIPIKKVLVINHLYVCNNAGTILMFKIENNKKYNKYNSIIPNIYDLKWLKEAKMKVSEDTQKFRS